MQEEEEFFVILMRGPQKLLEVAMKKMESKDYKVCCAS